MCYSFWQIKPYNLQTEFVLNNPEEVGLELD